MMTFRRSFRAKFKNKVLGFILFFLSFFAENKAQYYHNGQEPASVQWRQVQTNMFQVIYPESYEAQGKLLAHWLEQAYEQVAEGMKTNPRKISVILHGKTSYSNGMVMWAPRRVELYNTPSQQNVGQNWMQHLVLHEYRHVVQVEKMHQDFTKVLSWLMGEQATVIPLGLYMPMWFLEGDAVSIETGLSKSGRGRDPEFLQGFKAMTMEKGKQGYDRAILGSYKMYVPNHYETGYQVAAINRKYKSADVFEQKLDSIAKRWWMLFIGSGAGLRDGKKDNKYYGFAMDYLVEKWTKENAEEGKVNYPSFVEPVKRYEDFASIQTDGGKMYAIRTSLDKLPEIVELDTAGKVKSLIKTGHYADDMFSASGGYLMWSEQRNDKRWEGRAWNDVYAYDIEKKSVKRITRRGRYFAPVKSPVDNQFVAVLANETDEYNLILMDLKSGIPTRKIPNTANGYIFHPSWMPDGKSLVYVYLGENGKELRRYHLDSNKEETLINGNYVEMGYPSCTQDAVYFTAAWNTQNDIYRYDLKTGETTLQTRALYGANYVQPLDSGKIVFANYTADGYKPVILNAEHQVKKVQDVSVRPAFELAEMLSQQEGEPVVFDSVASPELKSEKYSKIGHLFNFHSWSFPIAINPMGDATSEMLHPGITVMSQNMLASSFITAGINTLEDKRLERYYVNYTYEGWYPKMDFYFKTGQSDLYSYYNDLYATYNWQQYITGASATLPFKVYKGIYYGGIFPAFGLEWIHRNAEFKDGIGEVWTESFDQNIIDLGTRLTLYRYRQMATRDLYPKWGQYLQLGYNSGNVSDYAYGTIAYGIAQAYFPGFFNHHSFNFSLGVQNKWKGDPSGENEYYYPSDKIAMARGTTKNYDETYYGDQLLTFKSDYNFPAFYPDWNLGQFIYLKRVNLGAFYDYTKIRMSEYRPAPASTYRFYSEHYSAGGSISFDFHPLRYETEIRLEVESGMDIEKNSQFWNLLFSISL